MAAEPLGPILLCRIGRNRVALEAASVREVLPMLPLWRPPTLPRPLAGMAEVRGKVLPVVDPRLLFSGEAAAEAPDIWAHIVRPRGAPGACPCLLVDRVEDVVTPAPDAVRPVGDDQSFNGAVVAELLLPDGAAHLLSLDRLLDSAERARVAALTGEAVRRVKLWSTPELA